MSKQVNAGLRGLRDPVVIAAFSGWSDAGNAASAAVEHLAEAYQAELAVRARPRRLLRLPGQPSRGGPQPRRRAGDHLADHADQDRAAARWPGPDPGRGHRAQPALAPVRRPDHLGPALGEPLPGVRAGRAAGRHPAHPAGAGHHHHPRPRPDGGVRDRRVDLRGSDRHRRGDGRPAGAVRAAHDVGVGSDPPLRVAPAVPQGDAGDPVPAGAAAGRAARFRRAAGAGPSLGARRERAGGRGQRGRRVRAQLEEQQDAAELPEASGDAIAAEFERYLKRRQGG